MSVEALSWVFQHSESRLGPRHVLLAIANHAKSDGTGAWPSVATIAREAKLSIRQVQYCLIGLVKMGELRISRSKAQHGCNLYSLPGVQGLRTSTMQNTTSGVQNRVPKTAPESKSIEPSLKQPIPEARRKREEAEKHRWERICAARRGAA